MQELLCRQEDVVCFGYCWNLAVCWIETVGAHSAHPSGVGDKELGKVIVVGALTSDVTINSMRLP